ncbi:hypothetical protein SAMN05444679_12366 [Variovorax sp. CF079]|uniref:hypothetical protein n=1 Tax=Variovorax sp. CF079 TaxID=1882774 RepID=UPI000880578A|nr:hypothetical protein [Variovorax sp. CF079]SDE47610.1 hypothetical protein SAMN05444679_12366 [Variovorax sp. CF079]
MISRHTRTLKALAFVLATLGATALLVAAGLAEEPQPAAAMRACIICLPVNAR